MVCSARPQIFSAPLSRSSHDSGAASNLPIFHLTLTDHENSP